MNNFDIYLENKEKIKLSENNLINSGGEGKIYIKDGFAYKIFFNKNKTITKEKIEELKKLDKENIINPIQIIKNKENEFIGYQMKAIDVNNCYPLTRFLTNDFRKQHSVKNEDVVNIIKKIYETFEFIHSKKCLIVDGNEMNYLISSDFKEVYFIDVDSYQTAKNKATAYNPLTIDPLLKNNQFSENSDWYIFGVLFCQIVLGIHPFKGKYVGTSISVDNRDIQERMRKGVSIFRKNIKLNSAVRSFSLIPKNMLDWLEKIFDNKIREKPPLINIINDTKIIFDKNINKEIKTILIKSFDNQVDDIFFFNNFVYKSNGFFYYENQKLLDTSYEIMFIKDKIVFLKKDNNKLFLYTRKEKFEIFKNVKDFYVLNNNLYVVSNNKMMNIEINKINNKYLPSVSNSWHIFEYKKFNNVFLMYQNNGIILYNINKNKNSIININDIVNKNEKIIDIKGFEEYLIIITNNNSNYNLKIYNIDEFSKEKTLLYESITDNPYIDFIFNEDILIGKKNNDELIIGYYKKEDKEFKYKKIDEVFFSSKIYYLDKKVLYIKDKKIIQIKM